MTQNCSRSLVRTLVSLAVLAVLPTGHDVSAAEAARVDYIRDVRPILSDTCYQCHGPDEQHREGGLRLDQKDSALGESDSGEIALVPGDPASSELVRRILSDNVDEQMPPAESGKRLTEQQKQLIKTWIAQGAAWEEHWAFVPPRRGQVPSTDTAWAAGAIDRFIGAKLKAAGLVPSPAADKATLLRRVTFDLTGLPPTVADVEAFLADDSPTAYERVVDRLLASPRYGEHMARFWLDAARYGDTHGLHLDNYREMWPYRDWVVRAFNDNMPFDQFTIEQLAGDLLENATRDQRIASGFNRCHVTTAEGGSITEEVYVRNVKDRVVTTGTVFMGLTLECTSCHDHKYDPLTMKDFYSLFAFFNSLDGNALDGNKKKHAPFVRLTTPEAQQRLDKIDADIAAVRQRIRSELDRFEYAEPELSSDDEPERRDFVWFDDEPPAGAKRNSDWQLVGAPAPVYSGQRSLTRTSDGLSQDYFINAAKPLVVAEGDVLFVYVYLDNENPPRQIMLQWNDGHWAHRAYWGESHIDWGKDKTASRQHIGPLPPTGVWTRLEVPVDQVGLKKRAAINGWAFTQYDGTVWWDKAGIVSTTATQLAARSLSAWSRQQTTKKDAKLPKDVAQILDIEPAARRPQQQARLRDYYLEHVLAASRKIFLPLHQEQRELVERRAKLDDELPISLVFKERAEPRTAFMLNRGEYDQRREKVERQTPKILPPFSSDAPRNRLGLAQWLVNPRHPLTARVVVNRFWQQVFGTGIVKTAEDFGSQGEVPSHPKLLDWLAVQFIDDGWDVKATMKRLVMSATYRQSSRVSPQLVERDPENRLLARGPRFRLDAEMLRDQALATSGLLVNQLGGPSVKPPQPAGLWFAVGYSGSNTVRFKADTGPEKVHRRTLYTFIKRTAPPPQMSTFDGPSRESCSVRRERTNTPLQALLLMNDPQFFEAARALAERAIRDGGHQAESRAAFMFRVCTARQPSADEVAELVRLQKDHLAEYTRDVESAKRLVAVGALKLAAEVDVAELAAWTMVANLMLNLDEVLNKN